MSAADTSLARTPPNLRGYACYWKDTDDGLRVHDGVTILVHDSIHSQEIAFQSTLPVVSVNVTMTHLSFIVCSFYLHPCQPLSATNLIDLFSELPSPFMVGDFNAHNSLWGSSRACQRGAVHWILLGQIGPNLGHPFISLTSLLRMSVL